MRFCENPNGCKWPVFSTDKLTGKGYCKSCANKYRTDLDRRTIIQRAMAKQQSLNTKIRSLANTDANLEMTVKHITKGELQEWFNYHMSINERICENCRTSLKHYNRIDWMGSQHHLIEKSLCPSVATELQNHAVIGKWCCHSQAHTSFLNQSKMPFFPLAKERVKLFIHLIPPDELRKVNHYLL